MRMLFLCFALWAGAAGAQDAATAAQAAARQLEDASAALVAAGSSRDRVAALTETVRAYEDGLIALRDGLRQAAIRQRSLAARLDAKRAEVERLLGVLQSVGHAPRPVLLLHPAGPLGAARAGMVAAELTPALQQQVDALRLELEEMALLRGLQETAVDTLQNGMTGAQEARAALSAAIADRTDPPRRFVEDPVQTALLIASTETLDSFAAGLQSSLADPETAAAVPDRGSLSLPVQGSLLRGYNAPDAAGIVRPGVILAARPRALVTAPVPATLLFRGPLLDYGNVVIIEPAADVLFVFAGLAEVFGAAGDIVPAGAPLGLLGGDLPGLDDKLTASDAITGPASSETLYLEVREGQSPVDPADWFALE